MADFKLDRLDRRIIRALDSTTRRSISDIAREVRLGRDLTAYRIDRFTNTGLIKKVVAFIDPSMLGVSVYKTYLKLGGSTKKIKQLKVLLAKHPEVHWFVEFYGAWDMMFSLFARSALEYEKQQHEILDSFTDIIRLSSVAIATCVEGYPRRYLTGAPGIAFRYGETLQTVHIDPLDIAILAELSLDARSSATEIGQRVNAPALTVSRHIERLESDQIIIGYRAQLDLSLLGLTLFKLQIATTHSSPEIQSTLRQFCARRLEVSYLVRQVGTFSYELEFEAADMREAQEIIQDLGDTLENTLRGLEHLVVYTDHPHRVPVKALSHWR